MKREVPWLAALLLIGCMALAELALRQRSETDKGRRDFVICLKCTYIYGYDAKGTELGMDPDNGMLTKLKACYLDEFVLDEGVQKQP